ncbi:chorismate synthase [Elusimicrobium posterum]|uniref:chorismate synthase n=1 Tax=Elusimicrobium posterum TaxID=3116653 RepID=UPI003C73BD51
MGGNTFGKIFKVITFGESHGAGVGAVVDGIPAGMTLSEQDINAELERRRPGASAYTTPRKEADAVKIISGVFGAKTTGAPIMLLIENTNTKSSDYDALKDLYRPSHADFTYMEKYGLRDWRGGGRASARETAARVAAGAIAQKYLREKAGIEFLSHTAAVGGVSLGALNPNLTRAQIENSPVRCPDAETSKLMEAEILAAKSEGDSVGSIVRGVIKNVPAGLGEPVFDKISAELAKAMLSINAAKGFEFGNGFEAAKLRGSQNNDSFINKDGKVVTEANRNGGILGGISTGEDIYFNVAFKPTPTIGKEQKTVDVNGNPVTIAAAGRHDPCLAPRAVAVVDAMAALVIMDLYLQNKISKI